VSDPDRPVLPDQTSDDTDHGWGDEPVLDDDERLRAELPPHWADRDREDRD
jgi:hypothetical protein